MAWDIDLMDELPGVGAVRLALPAAFPLEALRFEVDPRLELKLPHVERGGKLCLGLWAMPADLHDARAAVARGLEQLSQNFLSNLDKAGWVEDSFHEERLTYWSLHCTDRRRATWAARRTGRVHFDGSDLGAWALGSVVGYLRPGTACGAFHTQVVTCQGRDPKSLAERHRWAHGTAVSGHALIVRLANDVRWTPSTWPRNAIALNSLIRRATVGEASLELLLAAAAGDLRQFEKKPKFRTTHTGRQVPRPHAAPQLIVLLVQDGATYGFQVRPVLGLSNRHLAIEPIAVGRTDADWSLARDHALPRLKARREMRVLLLGVGSLGSPIAVLLARAGVGHMTLVDNQQMEAENTSRHALGHQHLGLAKAPALAEEIASAVPGIEVSGVCADACTWIEKHRSSEKFDLVIDCTAERIVRNNITVQRAEKFSCTPVVHAWLEPLCSAGHVILSHPDVPWPLEDPANTHVNASDLSVDDTRVDNPACSGGFHPYGAADVTQVAAFAAERILTVLDAPQTASTVWSWVRSQAFFDSLPLAVTTRAIVPKAGGAHDVATTTRALSEVLGPE